MSIAIAGDNALAVLEASREGEPQELIESYVKQHNELRKTMEWMHSEGILHSRDKPAWEQTLKALSQIAQALDAGFDPFTPPPAWFSGQLSTYRGAVPEQVRPLVSKARPIFGDSGLTVHDPRPDRFQPALDPIITGDVTLEGKKHCFLVAQWDLDQDLRYLTEGNQLGTMREQIARSLAEHNSRWVK